jgi:hypothetical protein
MQNHVRLSSPANGSRERAPDDRLQRVIQYPEAVMIDLKGHGVLDRPVKPGDDARRDPAAAQTSAKSSLASMVNRVLTSPYLWWPDPSFRPSHVRVGRPRVLALQVWQ